MVDSDESPKQAPSMSLATLRAIEEIATNKSATPYKRAFAAGILLMTYASLRFSDVQRIRSFECNEDAVHGTLLICKTKKQHGQHWPWASPPGRHNRFARVGSAARRYEDGLSQNQWG